MIDYYLNISELNTESRIQECYDYYVKQDLTFGELYKEYDRISEVKTRIDIDKKTVIGKLIFLLSIIIDLDFIIFSSSNFLILFQHGVFDRPTFFESSESG